jgi:RNA polymerase sigma-32 factor
MNANCTDIQLMNPLLPVGSIEAYLQRINQIPLLTQEEEYDFAYRLQEHGDLQAAQKLILAHIRYVARIARGYMGYGLALSDLIQEGTVGLMKAVKRFNPAVGVRLVSFAVHWIKSEIHEFILRNWRIVKVATTKAQRKLFFNLRSAKKRLGWFSNEEVETLAKDLGVSAMEVRRMEQRLNARDVQFDLPTESGDDTCPLLCPAEYLEDQQANPEMQLASNRWNTLASAQLKEALLQLDARSREILERRWLTEDSKATLQELAAKYNVSPERIRQLEKSAMLKIKDNMTLAEAA